MKFFALLLALTSGPAWAEGNAAALHREVKCAVASYYFQKTELGNAHRDQAMRMADGVVESFQGCPRHSNAVISSPPKPLNVAHPGSSGEFCVGWLMAKNERGLATEDPYADYFDFGGADLVEAEQIAHELNDRFEKFYTTAECSIEGASE